MSCPAINDAAFLSSVMAHLDCQAVNFGTAGYGFVSAAAVPLITSALTLAIAIFGYRMVVDDGPDFADLMSLAIRTGFVLALALSWPWMRGSVYELVMQTPSTLAATLAGGTGVPGLDGTLVARLQEVDWQMEELAQRGAGVLSPVDAGQTPTGAQRRVDAPRDWTMLASARGLFLAGTLGPYALTRLLAGLLLALTPIFAMLLLFARTRSLFESWLKALGGLALAALALAVVQAVQLALVAPWLAEVVGYRRAEIATPAAPVELFALVTIFTGASLGVLYAASRVVAGGAFVERARFRVERPTRWLGAQWATPSLSSPRMAVAGDTHVRNSTVSRAEVMSRSLTHSLAREALRDERHAGARGASVRVSAADAANAAGASAPLRHPHRRTLRRASLLSDRRDARS